MLRPFPWVLTQYYTTKHSHGKFEMLLTFKNNRDVDDMIKHVNYCTSVKPR